MESWCSQGEALQVLLSSELVVIHDPSNDMHGYWVEPQPGQSQGHVTGEKTLRPTPFVDRRDDGAIGQVWAVSTVSRGELAEWWEDFTANTA